MTHATVTVDGRQFIVCAPRVYAQAPAYGGNIIVAYIYWSTRNGEPFGPQRIAATNSAGKVGRQIVALAREAFDVDHEAMIADYVATR